MTRISRASRRLAALSLFVLSLAAPAGASPLADLVEDLETWLDANTDLARRKTAPDIRLVSMSLARTEYGSAGVMGGRLRAYYDATSETINLVAPWNPKDQADRSILLHELVHHRQAPHHVRCDGAKELPAYRLQEAWAKERGVTLNINWIAVVLESGCSRRDHHPD